MAGFELEFKMDNAAFSEWPEGEISRILKVVINKVNSGKGDGVIMDANGNRVGEWGYNIDE